MHTKTLQEYFSQKWPDAVFVKPNELLSNNEVSLSIQHRQLLEKEIDENRQELFAFIEHNLTLELLEEETCVFLKENKVQIMSAPLTPAKPILVNERMFLALDDLEQKLGSVYHLIHYPGSGVNIVYTYFGQLQWTPQ
jgi:hypothetical protein